uniref:NADH-ubiquinone oxidoreductase chain 6 n=1 Tax=Validiblatta fuliginosa TaxID=36977 RepID=Q6BDT8_VALFU|nr:NADH dehydrogenase subunit 6 [Periplaneta fuliginosa]BAD32639.1 NADH dehydrogenase subunit 6 [Periplaneta fuliginosa]
MKYILIIMLTTSMTFTQMKHPLTMGLMLLIQTVIMCMTSGMLSQSFWFSYVLFLIFLGGMLVLFIYVTSLASNEMFYMSMKMMLAMITIMLVLFLLINMDQMINNMEIMMHEYLYNMENEMMNSLTKLYNQPTNLITIMLASYLFLTLIVVVKITNISKGPLRQMN